VKLSSARRETEELQRVIGEYHQSRATTRQGTIGRPDLVSQVAARRDDTLEQKAATDFRLLATAALGHEPTTEEIETGTALLAASNSDSPVVRGGARSLTSLFRFLVTREREIQKELGLVSGGLGSTALRYGLPVAGVVGAGALGYYLWRRYKRPPMPGEPGAPDLEEGTDDDE
jgi:hypothetical protein